MVAGWAVQGVGDPQRRVGCQLCSRLPEGLLTQVVPALLATSLQSPVWPMGAGSPLAQAWLSHAGTVACPMLGPWHVPGHQEVLLGELLLMPQPFPCTVWGQPGQVPVPSLGSHSSTELRDGLPGQRQRGSAGVAPGLGSRARDLGRGSSSPEMFGAENNEPCC